MNHFKDKEKKKVLLIDSSSYFTENITRVLMDNNYDVELTDIDFEFVKKYDEMELSEIEAVISNVDLNRGIDKTKSLFKQSICHGIHAPVIILGPDQSILSETFTKQGYEYVTQLIDHDSLRRDQSNIVDWGYVINQIDAILDKKYFRPDDYVPEFLSKLEKNMEKEIPWVFEHKDKPNTLLRRMGYRLNLNSREMEILELINLYHDAAKICFSDEFRSKTDKPTLDERAEFILPHPKKSGLIMKSLSLCFLEGTPERNVYEQASLGITDHHEACNGSGYNGKTGPEINKYAKVFRPISDFSSSMSNPPHKNLDVNNHKLTADFAYKRIIVDNTRLGLYCPNTMHHLIEEVHDTYPEIKNKLRIGNFRRSLRSKQMAELTGIQYNSGNFI